MLSKLAYEQNRDITSKESDQLFNLLLSYADIFADNLTDVGHTHLTKHTNKTGAPRYVEEGRFGNTLDDFQPLTDSRLLQDMLKKDTIRPSQSPWAAPIVLVRKKSGYLDDIIILGKDFTSHLNNIQLVFECLRQAGLKLQHAKCTLCGESVSFLGDIVSSS